MAEFENPFDPFGDFAPPRSRFRVTRFEAREKLREARAAVPAIPLPIPTQGNPFPFPTGPAANDPIFRPPVGIGGVILAGGIGIIITTTGVQIAERVAKLKKKRKEDEERAEEANRKRREEREEDFGRVQTIPSPELPEKLPGIGGPIPEIFGRPRRAEFPQIPGRFPTREPPPLEIPDIKFPEQVPAPGKGPETLPFPETLPVPDFPLPEPVPRPAPNPAEIPGIGVPRTLPKRAPGRFPGRFPGRPPGRAPGRAPGRSPGRAPQRSPGRSPGRSPNVDPGNLTRFNPRGVPLQRGFIDLSDQTDPSAEAQPEAERCRTVKNRRRKRNECFEGFYAEYPGQTDFKTWRKVDCTSRREIK